MSPAVLTMPTSVDRGPEVLDQHTFKCLTVIGESSRRNPLCSRTQLYLHGEGPVTYECIIKGSIHTSLLNDQGQEEDMQGCTLKKQVGWSVANRPT